MFVTLSKNQAAFVTTTGLAVLTTLSVVAAISTTSTIAAIACAVLGLTSGGASIASITAWLDTSSDTADGYFKIFKYHAGIAVAGAYQFFSQAMLQALIDGLIKGISTKVRRAISGPDTTVREV